MPNSKTKLLNGAVRLIATTLCVGLVWVAAPSSSRAAPAEAPEAGPRGKKDPKPKANKADEGAKPGGMLKVTPRGGAAKAVKGKEGAKGAAGKGDGKDGKDKKDDKDKDKNAAGEDGMDEEVSPWSSVNAPSELSTGIEYQKPKRGTRFSFNLVDADLIELIKIIGNITGKSFILGGKVPNIKATIYAPTKITTNEAYQAFLSVLRVNGLTVIPAGRYLKILSVGGATSQNTPILKGAVPSGDQIITRLQPLQHVAAEDLSQLLDRFKSADGDITVYGPTNTLIITDYGVSIKRLTKLIGLLDVPGTGEQIWIEPVNYAAASELAERIIEIFDISATAPKKKSTKKKVTKRKAGTKARSSGAVSVGQDDDADAKISKIIPDERTNSLIIVSTETAYLRVLELIKMLDIPIAGEGTLHVHKLQHADATELAKTLNNLTRSRGTSKKKGKSASSGGATASLFEGELQISADKATNSIVVVSSLRDYISLKTVIDQLDQMQRQVFVEAVIMEVSLDKNRDLGLSFHGGNVVDTGGKDSLVYGSSQPNDQISSLLLTPGAMSGLAAGMRGPDLEGSEELVGISIPAFGVALQALQTNSDVNVLSTPNVLATDNVEASIEVGENVPIQQGYNPAGAMLSQAARSMGGSGAASQLGGLGMMGGLGGGFGGFSIGRQNVGLKLKITPHINDDDQVRLEIDLEISEVKSVDSNIGPNISQQSARTTSVVADQQTIVIGGLITDNQVQTTEKVPVLGDIPILGFLFRSKHSLTKKRNLLIFLTPYIIRDANDFRDIFTRKMAERREFIERYTAFEYHRIDPHLDWGRTNGAIAEMNGIITQAEEDHELKSLSELTNEVPHTPKKPIEFPHGESFQGGGSGEEGASQVGPALIEPIRVERAPEAE